MNTMLHSNDNQSSKSFSIFVDLFNKGEFNEIVVIPEKKEFKVLLDNIKLATITKDVQKNSWIKLNGSMPGEKIEQVGDLINLRLRH